MKFIGYIIRKAVNLDNTISVIEFCKTNSATISRLFLLTPFRKSLLIVLSVFINTIYLKLLGISIKVGTRGVMVIVAGNGHGDTSSIPGLNAFHIALIPLGKV